MSKQRPERHCSEPGDHRSADCRFSVLSDRAFPRVARFRFASGCPVRGRLPALFAALTCLALVSGALLGALDGCQHAAVTPTSGGAPHQPQSAPSAWEAGRPSGEVPEPARMMVLPGAGGGGEAFSLSAGGPAFAAILAYARNLAGNAAAVTLDAGQEVSAGPGAGDIPPDLGGVLLVFERPVTISLTSPVDMRLRVYQADPWLRFSAVETSCMFIPWPRWSGRSVVGSFYLLHHGGWVTALGRQPHDRQPEARWAALWSPVVARADSYWLDGVLRRYTDADDLRPGWPAPPRGSPPPCASPAPPGADPVWPKPPAESLPRPSHVIAYLPNGARVELVAGSPSCRRLCRIIEGTLDSATVTGWATDEPPLGLCQPGGPEPDWPGVLLVYDQPVLIVTRTPVVPEYARQFIVAWCETRLPGVVRAYFPALVPGVKAPPLTDSIYLFDQPGSYEEYPFFWWVGSGPGAADRQRALGTVLLQLTRRRACGTSQ